MVTEPVQYDLVRVFPPGNIAIPAQQSGAGEGLSNFLLQLLGAEAEIPYPATITAGTGLRYRRPLVALVTEQEVFSQVIAEVGIAAAAGENITTIATLDGGGGPAPVEEKDCLLPVDKDGLNRSR